MDADIKWLIGILITVAIAFALMLIAAFRNLSSKWSTSAATLHQKIEDGDKSIIEKIDAVKENYVRRDDLDGHIQRLDQTVNDLRREQKELRDEQRGQHLKVMEAIATAAGQR